MEGRTACTGLPQGVNLHKCVNVKQAGTKIGLAHCRCCLDGYSLEKQHKMCVCWEVSVHLEHIEFAAASPLLVLCLFTSTLLKHFKIFKLV